jgi:hypothetical protein
MDAFEPQYPARAASDALTAREAVAIFYRLSQPDMPADINIDRT